MGRRSVENGSKLPAPAVSVKRPRCAATNALAVFSEHGCRTRHIETCRLYCFEDFERIQAHSKPVKIVDGMNDWPALRLWQSKRSLEHLSKLDPDATVEVESSKTTSCFYGDDRYQEPVEMSFRSFLSILGQQEHREAQESEVTNFYLNQCPVFSELQSPKLPSITQDIRMPEFLPADLPSAQSCSSQDTAKQNANNSQSKFHIMEINLWMTQHFSRTNWHYDTWNNLLSLVRGRKELLLCPPVHSHRLKPHPVYAVMPNHSKQTLPPPFDGTNTARATKADCKCSHMAFAPCPSELWDVPLLRVSLEAGDMLFLPEGWWHQVDTGPVTGDTLNLSIAVNFWWRKSFGWSNHDEKKSAPNTGFQPQPRVMADLVSRDMYNVREGLTRLIKREQLIILSDIEHVVASCFEVSARAQNEGHDDNPMADQDTKVVAQKSARTGSHTIDTEVRKLFESALPPDMVDSDKKAGAPGHQLTLLLELPEQFFRLVMEIACQEPVSLANLIRLLSPPALFGLLSKMRNSKVEVDVLTALFRLDENLTGYIQEQEQQFARQAYKLVLEKYFGEI